MVVLHCGDRREPNMTPPLQPLVLKAGKGISNTQVEGMSRQMTIVWEADGDSADKLRHCEREMLFGTV
jgi:hypothetical protein